MQNFFKKRTEISQMALECVWTSSGRLDGRLDVRTASGRPDTCPDAISMASGHVQTTISMGISMELAKDTSGQVN